MNNRKGISRNHLAGNWTLKKKMTEKVRTGPDRKNTEQRELRLDHYRGIQDRADGGKQGSNPGRMGQGFKKKGERELTNRGKRWEYEK